MEQLSEKLFDFFASIPKSYYLPIVLALSGLIFLSIGLIQYISGEKQVSSQENVAKQQVASSSAQSMNTIQIDVEGAVMHPGLYRVPQDARLQDALVAAGGLSGDADRETVAKTLNLATKLTDGAKVYVPKIGDVAQSQGTVLDTQTGLVNINTASASDLDGLPGVGPATVQKIIAARPFASIDDLLTKKAVSQSVFEKIKDKITAL